MPVNRSLRDKQLDKLEFGGEFATHQSLPLMREVPQRGGGRELPLSQPIRLTAPLTRGALGAVSAS